MKPTLADLENLARGAGEILRASFGGRLAISHKCVIDLVTEADHRSEAYLLNEIQERFPSHHIITEESGEVQGLDEYRWYIDPLDGTINYSHGNPIFCVSIGYEEQGVLCLGAIYDPLRDECFSAAKGQGAWLNGKPICTSQVQSLDQSLLVTGFPYDIRTNPDNNLDHYARFTLCTHAVRRLGSAAMDLAYVAAGRFDGYWEIRIKPWDVAAGGLIAAEAGAIVTDLHGAPNFLVPPYSILAANAFIYPQMLEVLHEK